MTISVGEVSHLHNSRKMFKRQEFSENFCTSVKNIQKPFGQKSRRKQETKILFASAAIVQSPREGHKTYGNLPRGPLKHFLISAPRLRP